MIWKTLALLALLAGAAALGYAFRGDRNQAAITAAKTDAALCVDAAKGTDASLAEVRKRLADLQQRHDAALAAATKAMDLRDDEITRLSDIAVARTLTLRKNAHEDPDCTALADLAVCASVAGQLWPDPPKAAAADRDAH